ncbi:YhcN/YlaJ family sporulation lipoprotein [Alkalibacillus aidingensis]|uniref:YhcN/YlaJ family sporulation lipoprotein n=1 Tax=Alkalibacillus aidingensis TaxID=2747607 RepID=UPI0016611815|nr:YhcN/YlaJ family sporulation lipoprotein [Alkalibacillus aidingensis]
MFKKLGLLLTFTFLLTACTYVNPDDPDDSSLTNSEQSTEMQLDDEVTDEELIRINMYENPHEYFKHEEIDDSLENSDGQPHISEETSENNEQMRQVYYQVMHLDEVRQAGISIQDDQIYVAINVATRTDEDEAIAKVKEVVENITDRSDITVYVDREFHNRIEDRKD